MEAENQNMNSRVQQLYMQLLHEIVKKKDIELDSKTVEKKLLNQTVHLYELEVTLWKLVRPKFDLGFNLAAYILTAWSQMFQKYFQQISKWPAKKLKQHNLSSPIFVWIGSIEEITQMTSAVTSNFCFPSTFWNLEWKIAFELTFLSI